MEEDLTLEELNLLVDASRSKEKRYFEFMAAIQGIDLGGEADAEGDFARIEAKAKADLAGVSEEQYFLDMVGIDIESD